VKSIFSFLKTTFLGGLLFLLPFVLTMILLREALRYVAKVVGPVAEALPFHSVLGIKTPYFMATFILLLTGFVAGILAKTRLGSRISGSVENFVLHRIPGYTLFKGAIDGIQGFKDRSDISVVLVKTGEDKWQLAFVVEQNTDGILTVFTPSAPTPTSGSISFLRAEQVKKTDLTVAAAVKCIMQIGVGSGDLLRGQLPGSSGKSEGGKNA